MRMQEVCTSCAKGKPLVAMIPRAVQQITDVRGRVREELAGEEVEVRRAEEALDRAKAELETLERRVLERLGLPEGYVRTVRLRLDKELLSWKLWVPNIIATGLVMLGLISLLPSFKMVSQITDSTVFVFVVALTAAILLFAVIHEASHALGFWFFGRRKPGFKLEFGSFGLGFYTAGNCLLSRQEFLIVVLLPLLGITALGAILWLLTPQLDLLWYLVMGLNAAGAVGDLWIAKLLLQASPKALCLDTSYETAIFEPADEARQPTTAAT